MKLLYTVCLCVATTVVHSADWPQFRGPGYNGVSPEADLDFVNMKEKWRADVHTGFSAVTVVDGRVYTMGNKKGTDHIVCLDLSRKSERSGQNKVQEDVVGCVHSGMSVGPLLW